MSEKGTIHVLEPRAEAIFRWTAPEALGRDLAELIPAATDRDAHRRGLERFLRTASWSILDQRIETRGLRATLAFPLDLSMTAAGRRRLGVHLLHGDITEPQHGRRAPSHQLAFTSAITGHSAGRVALDRDGMITSSTRPPSAARLPRAELLGRHLGSCSMPGGGGARGRHPLSRVLSSGTTVHQDGGASERPTARPSPSPHTCSRS